MSWTGVSRDWTSAARASLRCGATDQPQRRIVRQLLDLAREHLGSVVAGGEPTMRDSQERTPLRQARSTRVRFLSVSLGSASTQ